MFRNEESAAAKPYGERPGDSRVLQSASRQTNLWPPGRVSLIIATKRPHRCFVVSAIAVVVPDKHGRIE
jgi:hypothetical protein